MYVEIIDVLCMGHWPCIKNKYTLSLCPHISFQTLTYRPSPCMTPSGTVLLPPCAGQLVD